MITFTKLRDGTWGLRGPRRELVGGRTVTVTKRSGETSEALVGMVVWQDETTAIARIERQARVERTLDQAAWHAAVLERYGVSLSREPFFIQRGVVYAGSEWVARLDPRGESLDPADACDWTPRLAHMPNGRTIEQADFQPLSTEHGEAADYARTAPVVVQHRELPGESWEDIFKNG